MDFKDSLQQIAERITKTKDSIKTEEATKNAFIMPFINALGYDVFDPEEVVPEMDCDLTKSGDKLDYAIMENGKPTILIECKHCNSNLNLHFSQLAKYYAASNAKFGVLTNGIEYRFYADLDKANIMDEEPFLVFNMLDFTTEETERLKKFHKRMFNEFMILNSAQELKYLTALKAILEQEFNSPTTEFVRFLARQIYKGQVKENVINLFTPLVKKSIQDLISETIADRLNIALQNEERAEIQTPQQPPEETEKLPDNIVFKDKESGITTTTEEIEAFNIIKAILCKDLDVDKIWYKDTKSYFAIGLAKNPSYYWFCRIFIGYQKKNITILTSDGSATNCYEFKNVNDIYSFSDELRAIAKYYIDKYNINKES